MTRTLTILLVWLAATALIIAVLAGGIGVAEPPGGVPDETPDPPRRRAESRAVASAPPARSHPGNAPPADDRPLAIPVAAPRHGVRGVVTSPCVVLEDGTNGVDATAWEARVYALVPSPDKTVDRIGILCEKAPQSARGDFAIDLPTGPHLILIQHRARRPGRSPVLEAWYAYAEITESDSGLTDLGRHVFASATIEGVVLKERGDPCGGATVGFSDETKDPRDPLPRGVYLTSTTDAAGRFAFSVGREAPGEVVGYLAARGDGLDARREAVRPGDTIELVLAPPEPQAEVVLEIAWSPGMRSWILAEDRRLGFMRDGGKAPPGGVVEERRILPLGRYVVEVFRRSEGCDTWARAGFEITSVHPVRIHVDPVFQCARTIVGRVRAGTKVAWVARFGDGSMLVRESALADSDGRFLLRGLPTTETFLSVGSILIPVPPGCEAVLDVGELQSG